MAKTLFRSLRWRATFWMAVFLLAIAVAIRFVTAGVWIGAVWLWPFPLPFPLL